MTDPRAVIFAAHPWDGVPYGLHHITRGLARLGWQVLYVEPFFSPLHVISGRGRGRKIGRRPRVTDEPGVLALSLFTVVPHANLPLLRAAATLRLSRHLSWPRLGRNPLVDTQFATPDLVLCGSPTAVEIALSIRARLNLYRLADDSSLFDALTQAAKQAEIDAIARFDGVIASSSVLEHHARQLSARQVLLVSNGVDRELFERAAPPPAVISDLPKPIILYAGAVESWFNWQLVDQSARARPSYSFVIVGRIGSRPPANIPSNVLLLGQRPYSEMPAFMQAASVGIIPFGSGDGAKAIRAINPLKLYEYLAAGRPVVSSVQPPNVNCPGLFVYSDQSSFLDCLDKAVSLNRSATKITAPRSVDWAEIVKDLLKRVGLPYKAPAAP